LLTQMAQAGIAYSALIQNTIHKPDGVLYYEIRVSVGQESWHVHRRYNEFAALHAALCWQLVSLPPMPEKSFWRKTFSHSFRTSRQACLNSILQVAIAADVTLSRLRPLREFLGAAAIQANTVFPVAPVVVTGQQANSAQALDTQMPHLPPVPQAEPVYTQAVAPPFLTSPSPAQVLQAQPAYTQPSAPPCQSSPSPAQMPSPAGYVHAQPACVQPQISQPGYVYARPIPQQMQQGYVYQQSVPGFVQTSAVYSQQPPVLVGQVPYQEHQYHHNHGYHHHHHHGHSSGPSVATAAVAAGAAGLVGGMLLENAIENRRHEFIEGHVGFGNETIFEDVRPAGFLGLGSEQVITDVRTDLFGDTEIRREVVDRDMFGNVDGFREEVIDRDMFGNVREQVVDVDWSDW